MPLFKVLSSYSPKFYKFYKVDKAVIFTLSLSYWYRSDLKSKTFNRKSKKSAHVLLLTLRLSSPRSVKFWFQGFSSLNGCYAPPSEKEKSPPPLCANSAPLPMISYLSGALRVQSCLCKFKTTLNCLVRCFLGVGLGI